MQSTDDSTATSKDKSHKKQLDLGDYRSACGQRLPSRVDERLRYTYVTDVIEIGDRPKQAQMLLPLLIVHYDCLCDCTDNAPGHDRSQTDLCLGTEQRGRTISNVVPTGQSNNTSKQPRCLRQAVVVVAFRTTGGRNQEATSSQRKCGLL
ncbi:hypothetical protein RP20_CCG004021 [Aedes albopictus]|nr:hypothetical protein RP20_CCG004021 [Aedes albopictus]